MFTPIKLIFTLAKPVSSYLFTISQYLTKKVSPVIKDVRSHHASAGAGSGPTITNQAKPANTEKIQHSQEPSTKGYFILFYFISLYFIFNGVLDN